MILWLIGCGPDPSFADGRLGPCPSSPNCVSSEQGTPESHRVDPLPLGDPALARERLLEIVASFPRTEILRAEPQYVHATFTTERLRFTDDVEFRLDERSGVVHLRSASRVGYGDRGVNRERVEQIRARWSSL
jgi:uncharacterized protein (DUF1499 family)